MASIGSGVMTEIATFMTHCCRLLFTQYDLSSSTYSPDGRIFQVEYAAKAVEASGYQLALCALVVTVVRSFLLIER